MNNSKCIFKNMHVLSSMGLTSAQTSTSTVRRSLPSKGFQMASEAERPRKSNLTSIVQVSISSWSFLLSTNMHVHWPPRPNDLGGHGFELKIKLSDLDYICSRAFLALLWPLIATFYKISGRVTFTAPDPSYLDHEPLISGSSNRW